MRRAFFAEGRFELGERLLGDSISDTVVSVDDDLLLLLGLGVRPVDLRVRNAFVDVARLTRTGTISSLNLPAFWAAAALAKLLAAKVSCTSREMLYCLATFSEVIPIGIRQSDDSGLDKTASDMRSGRTPAP